MLEAFTFYLIMILIFGSEISKILIDFYLVHLNLIANLEFFLFLLLFDFILILLIDFYQIPIQQCLVIFHQQFISFKKIIYNFQKLLT
jgi:hypothetical protein